MKYILLFFTFHFLMPQMSIGAEKDKIQVEKHFFGNTYRRNNAEIGLDDLKAELGKDKRLESKLNVYEFSRDIGYVFIPVGALFVLMPAVSKDFRPKHSIIFGVLGIIEGVGLIAYSNHLLGKTVEQYNDSTESESTIQPVINHEVDENRDEKTSIGIKIGL